VGLKFNDSYSENFDLGVAADGLYSVSLFNNICVPDEIMMVRIFVANIFPMKFNIEDLLLIGRFSRQAKLYISKGCTMIALHGAKFAKWCFCHN
jgi:hypothetical protein